MRNVEAKVDRSEDSISRKMVFVSLDVLMLRFSYGEEKGGRGPDFLNMNNYFKDGVSIFLVHDVLNTFKISQRNIMTIKRIQINKFSVSDSSGRDRKRLGWLEYVVFLYAV